MSTTTTPKIALVFHNDPGARARVSRGLQYRGFAVIQSGDADVASGVLRDNPEIDFIVAGNYYRGMDFLRQVKRSGLLVDDCQW